MKIVNIGRAFEMCREQRGMDRFELAHKSGLSEYTIRFFERGYMKNPPLALLGILSDVLGIPAFLVVFLASDEADLMGADKGMVEKLHELYENEYKKGE